jgi:hypothetical protein
MGVVEVGQAEPVAQLVGEDPDLVDVVLASQFRTGWMCSR